MVKLTSRDYELTGNVTGSTILRMSLSTATSGEGKAQFTKKYIGLVNTHDLPGWKTSYLKPLHQAFRVVGVLKASYLHLTTSRNESNQHTSRERREREKKNNNNAYYVMDVYN